MKRKTTILVVVDYQNDFAQPNGALYVPKAELIARRIQSEIHSGNYDKIVYTMDTHIPVEYERSQEAQMFPPHCEYNSWGWELHNIEPRNPMVKELMKTYTFGVPTDFMVGDEFVFVKDKFSIWEGNDNYEGFVCQFDKEHTHFVIVGVATNYCVHQNAMGYKERGFKNVSVIEDAVEGILDDTFESAISEMKSCDIKFV